MTKTLSWNVELGQKANTTVLEVSSGLNSFSRMHLAPIPVIQSLFRVPTQTSYILYGGRF